MRLPRIRKQVLIRMAVFGTLVFSVVWWMIPDYAGDLNDFDAAIKIYDRNGQPLRVVVDESDILCDPVPLEDCGEWTGRAVVAFEDKRFYRHGGVDSVAVCRAMLQNVTKARVVSGASTLTTLVVKLTEPRGRNLWTKLVEAHHARELESSLTKDEILEQYLNRAPFGGNVYGIEAASRRYFGKPARNLSLAESALLAGLPQSPSCMRPDRYVGMALCQRNVVLSRMLENEMITVEQYNHALQQKINIRREALPFRAPHFCTYMLERYSGQQDFRTTLDLELQSMAERVLQQRIEELSGYGVHGGAVVVLDVRTGELRAMVGSPEFWNASAAGQVNSAVSRRSPGSTLKPFAFAASLDEGAFTPAGLMADVPMHFAGYTPQNYSLEYSGPVSVRQALVQSLNIPALKCVEQIGPGAFVEKLRELGFSTLGRSAEYYGLGIAVGGCETTLLDLANAYACLARGGVWKPLQLLKDEFAGEERRIFSEAGAYMVADILGGDERSSELVGHMGDVVLPRVAWKTGTSSGLRDAWTVAYNPDYVVGVWLGNPDGSASAALVGGQAAGPIAGEIFRQLYPGGNSDWFEMPAGIKSRMVCSCSGLPPSKECGALVSDLYLPRISPMQQCGIHRGGKEIWPPEIQAFLARRGMNDSAETVMVDNLGIVSPFDGQTLRLLPASPGIRQELRLTASGMHSSPLYWFVDEAFFCSAAAGRPAFWPLQRGEHIVSCADAKGRTARARIVVQ